MADQPLRPRPRAALINCPNCGFPIDKHETEVRTQDGVRLWPNGFRDCRWTPNDIAWQLLFGELTPQPAPSRPLGAWE